MTSPSARIVIKAIDLAAVGKIGAGERYRLFPHIFNYKLRLRCYR